MRHAVFCECCGKPFDLNHKDNGNSNHVNGISFIDLDVDERYYSRETVALCPDCLAKVFNTLGMTKKGE